MNRIYSVKLCIILLGVALVSCQKELEIEKSEQLLNSEDQLQEPDRILALGKKLQNPYTVTNMQQAWQNLTHDEKSSVTEKIAGKTIEITATDYYVRFLPEDDRQKELLEKEDGLTLFDMPLDYELEEGVAGAYHDPSVSPEQITWQYTTVPVDYTFRENVAYEIVTGLFLQDEEDEDSKQAAKKQLSPQLWAALEDEALAITGNKDKDVKDASLAAKPKWYPSGTILYEDNTTGQIIPLEGTKVVVKRWFKWKSDITDANGEFRVGKFRSDKVKCAIKWERHEWDIRSGSYGQAWYSFETLRRGQNWNITIRRNTTPRNWLYASVHRGAMEYFYNHNAYNIRKPYNKGLFFNGRLHIGAKHTSGRSHYYTFNRMIWSAPVMIYSSGNNGPAYDSRDIFATIIHELAHVSHWEIGYSTGQYVIDALADDPFLPESWAVGVEHTIINAVYPNDPGYDFPYDNDMQDDELREIQTDSDGYTPIVIDMIDNINQSVNPVIDPDLPNDEVTGYTLGQLEDALPGSFGSWWSWRSRIRSMYNNPTEGAELDYLFSEYR